MTRVVAVLLGAVRVPPAFVRAVREYRVREAALRAEVDRILASGEQRHVDWRDAHH